MVTKYDLRRYQHISEDIIHLEEQIKEIELLMVVPGCQRITGMPSAHSFDQDKIGNVVAKVEKLKVLYYKKINGLLDLRFDIENAMNMALKINEQELIRLRYFSGLTWDETAAKMGISVVGVHRQHKSILEKLATDNL